MNNAALEPRADVVVVGGGIVGLACAYYLAQRGVAVTLLDKGAFGAEQSSRNWGFVRAQGRDSVELPLMAAGMRLWPELPALLEADIEWEQGGNLALAANAEELARYEAAAAACNAHGVGARMLSREEVSRLIPGLSGDFIGGVFTDTDGQADPAKATLAFARAAERHGARLHDHCAVNDILLRDGRVAGVRTDRGDVAADRVICAAGAHSTRLLRRMGISLPQRMVRSTVVVTAPLPPLTRVSVWGLGVAFRQARNGEMHLGRASAGSAIHDVTLDSLRHVRLFLPMYLKNREFFRMHIGAPLLDDLLRALPGSSARAHPFAHTVDVEPEPTPATEAASRQAFMRHFPGLGEVTIARRWAGIIEATPDLLPVLGPCGAAEGLVLATGFSGHGFAMGPIVGKVLTELIVDGRPSLDLNGFRLERFREGGRPQARRIL